MSMHCQGSIMPRHQLYLSSLMSSQVKCVNRVRSKVCGAVPYYRHHLTAVSIGHSTYYFRKKYFMYLGAHLVPNFLWMHFFKITGLALRVSLSVIGCFKLKNFSHFNTFAMYTIWENVAKAVIFFWKVIR